LNPDSEAAEKHATLYYASVRKMTTDVQSIAKNTGFSVDKIASIKEHVFYKEHDLGGDKKARFEPHYGMAQSWQRLIEGSNIQPHDITLLKHETAEMYYMRNGYSQETAHDKANIKFNYSSELKKYDLSKAKG